MRKNIAKKLALSTETIAALQSDVLEYVVGGNAAEAGPLKTAINCPTRNSCFTCLANCGGQ
jgi:hypothetical protein